MSTRCTIDYGDHHHLYTDLYEEGFVFVELSGEVRFDASPDMVTVAIPEGLWERLRVANRPGDASRTALASELNRAVAEKDRALEQLDEAVVQRDEAIAQRDAAIRQRNAVAAAFVEFTDSGGGEDHDVGLVAGEIRRVKPTEADRIGALVFKAEGEDRG